VRGMLSHLENGSVMRVRRGNQGEQSKGLTMKCSGHGESPVLFESLTLSSHSGFFFFFCSTGV
jgi:hypothetical protein